MVKLKRGDVITLQLKVNEAYDSKSHYKVVSPESDYELAIMVNPNLDSVHLSNLPFLPPDVPSDAKQLEYIILKSLDSNTQLAVAKVWLNSYTLVNSATYYLTLEGITNEEYSGLVKILNNYGLSGKYKLNSVES